MALSLEPVNPSVSTVSPDASNHIIGVDRMGTLLVGREGLGARFGLIMLVGSLLVAAPANADDMDDRLAAFKLFTNCEPIDFRVGGLHPVAENINLTREAIIDTVEGRLNEADMYGPDSDTYLFINVNLSDEAFDIILALKKQLYDRYSGESRPATTWPTGAVGTHESSPDAILTAIDGLMDKFLGEFQSVNEEACSQR
ncbi:MAG: hypothetical protein OXF33_08350 [Rhodospirillales bacterium]|nr:hypothetical protein [Rhodospirillales bacterium]